MAQIYDTIIVGAGWAGAVAARELSKAGRKVLILEARNRVGGRASTWTSNAGDKIDLGCAWIHGYNEGNPARAIATELGVSANLPSPAPGVLVGPSGPLSASAADKLRASLGAAQAKYRTPHPAPAPSASLASAFFSPESPLSADPLGAGLARTLEVPLGIPLERASLKYTGWEAGANYAGSDAAPEGGYEALVSAVVADAVARGATLQLSETVKQIQDGKDVAVMTDKGAYAARTVLSTIPLGVLKTSLDIFAPPLPARLAEVVQGTSVGVLEKLVLRYDAAWWPADIGSFVLLPEAAATTSDSSLHDILASCTFTVSNFAATLPGAAPVLVTYLSPTPATLLARFSDAKVVAAFHAFLQRRLGATGPAPVDSVRTAWAADPLARGATSTPTIVSDNGGRSPLDFVELSRPHWDGRLGFAGEHTDPTHRGSVAGAVVSGLREAERVGKWLDKHGK